MTAKSINKLSKSIPKSIQIRSGPEAPRRVGRGEGCCVAVGVQVLVYLLGSVLKVSCFREATVTLIPDLCAGTFADKKVEF